MNMHVMRMHENEWECMRITHIQGGVGVIQGGYTLDDIHENVWLSQHEWTCLCWECMRMAENGMHENDWGWLRIAHIQGGGVSFYVDIHCTTCMILYENAWEWLRIAHIQGGGGGHSRLIYIIRHAWECMRNQYNKKNCMPTSVGR